MQFVFVYNLPITPVGRVKESVKSKGNARQTESGDSLWKASTDFIVKFGLLFVCTALLTRPHLHILIKELCYAFGLYAFLGVMMQLVSMMSHALTGMGVAPHYDQPYLSCSFTDFWSRRWNLNTGYTLRFLIYDPICEGKIIRCSPSSPKKAPSKFRRGVAMCSAFIVSGVMHELFILYLRSRISGYWLAFFSIQGPCILMEWKIREWSKKRGLHVPWAGRVLLTLSILIWLGHLFFYPDILRMGIPQQVNRNIQDAYRIILPSGIQQILAQWI